ncbi:hypothetical protein A7S16_18800 [Salmonella enterica]|nr:hypothetical protein LTSERUB_6077 [Salmonella enterica subsp. enterica serovar Rubislaw str. A4-653]KMJ35837.1 hypothetical protein ABT74_20025 [Salmonella enterica subsp. enterica serovar Typhimurium]KSB51960.1 hypothetical protein LFZ1_20530 [Salmonella enterica subsp. enterica serovar Rubislaw str. SA20030553]OHG75683.1 hypothetical protein A7T44_20260 [Salmonella enterica subsp. enterica serovar Rubislaw]OHI09396.1 hypothetical protein A7S11_19120 [Salmonella enterica]RKD12286.1 hypothe
MSAKRCYFALYCSDEFSMIMPGKRGGFIMLESIINLVSSGAVDSHTPQTALAAVLCAALVGLFS